MFPLLHLDDIMDVVAHQLLDAWSVEELRSIAASCRQINGSAALLAVRKNSLTRRRAERLAAFSRKEGNSRAAMLAATQLDWTGKRLVPDDMEVFGKLLAMGAIPRLARLDLSCNQIGVDGITALAGAVGALTSLEHLWLGGNHIADVGVSVLAGAIGALPSLKIISLEMNQIGDTGVTALANAIGRGACARLTWLSLRDNQVGDAGLTALAETIDPLEVGVCGGGGRLAQLNLLGLARNRIGDVGVSALAARLGSGALTSLEQLWLGGNQIGDVGVSALAGAPLDLLQDLCLENNSIGDSGIADLAFAIGSGALASLKNLYLCGNPVSGVAKISIRNVLSKQSISCSI